MIEGVFPILIRLRGVHGFVRVAFRAVLSGSDMVIIAPNAGSHQGCADLRSLPSAGAPIYRRQNARCRHICRRLVTDTGRREAGRFSRVTHSIQNAGLGPKAGQVKACSVLFRTFKAIAVDIAADQPGVAQVQALVVQTQAD